MKWKSILKKIFVWHPLSSVLFIYLLIYSIFFIPLAPLFYMSPFLIIIAIWETIARKTFFT